MIIKAVVVRNDTSFFSTDLPLGTEFEIDTDQKSSAEMINKETNKVEGLQEFVLARKEGDGDSDWGWVPKEFLAVFDPSKKPN